VSAALAVAGCSDGGGDGGAPAGAPDTPVTAGTPAPSTSTSLSAAPAPTAAPASTATLAASSTASPGDDAPAPAPAPATTAAPAGLPLPAPEGDAFYVPPEPVPGDAPGDLIWARPLATAPPGTNGWQVLYRSESLAGAPIAVSGVVIAPGDVPDAGVPLVLSWAHGTTGLADRCAPSKRYAEGATVELALAQLVTGRGWTFVATDYEGLGTPGVHPYLVGPSEGRGVLDIVRAASHLDGSGVTPGAPAALFGHSQGGHAALMAAEIAPAWAPELDIVGTVAAAPPGSLRVIEDATAGQAGLIGGFSLLINAGLLAAYPDLDPDAALPPADQGLLAEVAETCVAEALQLAASLPPGRPSATADPAWAAAYDASSPGRADPEVPVLIVHGDVDEVVPASLSAVIADGYCELGVAVQRTVYPGADHVAVLTSSLGEVQGWIDARLAGDPPPSSCGG